MSFQYYVSGLEFSDGTKVPLGEGEFVLLIGPNNAGKSASLREINERISVPEGHPSSSKVVKEAAVVISRDVPAYEEFLASLDVQTHNPGHLSRMGAEASETHLRHVQKFPDLRRHIQPFTVKLLSATERISVTGPHQNIDYRSNSPNHPLHYVYKSETLERTISTEFRKAFGTDLVADKHAGAVVRMLVGDRPPVPAGQDRLSEDYQKALAALPTLEHQGDGMRSFVGTLLWARSVDYRVLLIDEPEAFLHPPQARLLGRILGLTKNRRTQIIAASHSGDLLRGALDAGAGNLRIIRITRRGGINPTKELRPDLLRELWADPLIRHSNLLDALFHEQCVICESDGDCHFYSAILQTIVDADPERQTPEVMYASVGGKQRLPKAVRALGELNISVKVIADFDVLREEQPLKATFEALGGTWADIEADWRVVSGAVSQRKAQLDVDDTKRKIDEVFRRAEGPYLTEAALKEIRSITRKASSWSEAKAIGEMFVPKGQPYETYQRLDRRLRKAGLFVVPVGELEGFDKTVGNYGPKWLEKVMEKELADPAFDVARDFVSAVVA